MKFNIEKFHTLSVHFIFDLEIKISQLFEYIKLFIKNAIDGIYFHKVPRDK